MDGIEARVQAVTVRCESWGCPSCRRRRGHLVRQRLHSLAAGLFPVPVLFTFTVDREAFGGPQDAYREVRRGKYLPRLMRLLGVSRWVSVLEFQEASGDGWPHWHLLCDASGLPGVWRNRETGDTRPQGWASGLSASDRRGWAWLSHYIDFSRAVQLVSGWGLSRHVRFSVGSRERKACSDPGRAVNYITKYLTKWPSRGLPGWVLESSRVRFLSASRAVGALVADGDQEERAEPGEDRNRARPLVDRVAQCGARVVLLGGGQVQRPDMWVAPGVLDHCPWLVSWTDYARISGAQVPYSARGFASWDDAGLFVRTVGNGSLQARLSARVAKRRAGSLAEWEAGASVKQT